MCSNQKAIAEEGSIGEWRMELHLSMASQKGAVSLGRAIVVNPARRLFRWLVLNLIVSKSQAFVLQKACPVKLEQGALLNHPSEDLENPIVAQNALQSARFARELRRYRSSRGRSSTFLVAATATAARETKNSPPLLEGGSPQPSQIRRSSTSQFHASGQVPNPMDLPFNTTYSALEAYYRQHGHVILPRRFVVPADPAYPSEWFGLDLSSTVYNMKWWLKHIKERPERVRQLSSLGFVWERLQPEWNLIIEALIAFLRLHGHTRVPQVFVVPHDNDEWPLSTWGLPLGSCVYRIRSRHDFLRGPQSLSRRLQLDRIGFVWDVSEQSFGLFYQALQQYAKLHRVGPYSILSRKALRVPSQFVVPSEKPWPEALWGYPLGEKCSAVRSKQLYVKRCSHRQQLLEDLGFRFNSELSWYRVVHAAAIYSQLNGRTLSVPYHFVVPVPPSPEHQDNWPWPPHLWGLKLGQRLKDVRVKNAYLRGSNGPARRRQLDALGMEWNPRRGRKLAKDSSDSKNKKAAPASTGVLHLVKDSAT